MSHSLSSYLSARAEQRHDSRIPADIRAFIAQVAAAERDLARDTPETERLLAGIGEAVRELTQQVGFYRRAYDRICLLNRHPEVPGYAAQLPAEREDRVRAEAEIIAATELIEELATKLRVTVRPVSTTGGRAA